MFTFFFLLFFCILCYVENSLLCIVFSIIVSFNILQYVFQSKTLEANKRLLDRLQEHVQLSHKVTFDRVTKYFDSRQEYSQIQYVGPKFREAGFGYPTSDDLIRRIVCGD